MNECFDGIYKGRRVLITGHTGFKGSWLSLWLKKMGAEVYGFSLAPPTQPSHHEILNVGFAESIENICSYEKLMEAVNNFKPDILFHLAAQPLVRQSYNAPVETFETNIMGTVHVLEAIRKTNLVKAAILITTDKCYENKEWIRGYNEGDRLGGHDPYSASKACAELVISSYENSFFKNTDILVASCRAGNVIGGGDWAEDRLIPDVVRAASNKRAVLVRNSGAIRPWQHVLESLSGYLLLGQRLLDKNKDCVGAWNFGPFEEENCSVKDVIMYAQNEWDAVDVEWGEENTGPHETTRLNLDSTKANEQLQWLPVWNSVELTIIKTINWYREFYENNMSISEKQLCEYIDAAREKGLVWAPK